MPDHATTELIVADTTPLLYLARIGLLDLLGRLYTRVVIPGSVWSELVEANPGAPGVEVIRAAAWLEIDRAADGSRMAMELAVDLDPGEAAAIALAVLRGADLLLIDDLDGRRAARARGLAIRGMVGVLIAAHDAGLVLALAPILDSLVAEGFRLDPTLHREVLRSVGETAKGP